MAFINGWVTWNGTPNGDWYSDNWIYPNVAGDNQPPPPEGSAVNLDGQSVYVLATDPPFVLGFGGGLEFGTLVLEGSFSVDDGGIIVENGGTVENQGTGTVGAYEDLIVQNDGALQNDASGTITVTSQGLITNQGGDYPFGGGLLNQGLIVLQSNTSIDLGTIANSGTIEAAGGYVVIHAAGQQLGIIAGAAMAGSTGPFVTPVTSDITGDNGLTGTLKIDSGATLELRGSISGNTVLFNSGGSEKLIIDDLASDVSGSQQQDFNAPIIGFAATDQIELYTLGMGLYGGITSVTPTNVTSSKTTLALDDLTYLVADLTLQGDYAGWTFNVAANDTITAMPCYCPGTLILTDRGEIAIERLAVGDRVITASGALRPIKWIGRRSFAGRFVAGRKDILPICIRAGALDEKVPKRDLWISPHHAMFLQGVLIEAKDLVNGVSIVQAEHVDTVTYFHIELDAHDVIIAEGALSETYIDEDNRGMFHNALEYDTLYAEEDVRLPACYCAPRLEDGYEVENVRRRLAARARAGTRPHPIKVHRRAARSRSGC